MMPYPFESYAQAGPPQWWHILAALGPWVLLLAVCIVGFVWWLALRQATRDAIRNDQWRRAVWALRASVDPNPKKRRIGNAVLDQLGNRAAAGSDEAKVIAQARPGTQKHDVRPSEMNDKPN
ncbi:hypothetical protein [Pseudarthrobacter sp. NamB4]|uniref:hypothetical protein n=1 Tax=Pseudarthrobacter sp. NamB4 TaxID=2576837 RepID=UPI0010FDE700|nr:hypothetical protein [Pseudarthrobacter sp. NamB4]TLM73147.1 hypothetical protein FDW81_10775 [Pseudarthrobacter sp. NamB4]